ncbi:MAG: DUF2804 family protein [Proteobacteria bacterium]|nr:DUF2804 family protein [Pseudomonadota bacterium]
MQQRPAPPTVVDDLGNFRFGTFTTPFYTPDFQAAEVSDMHPFMGRPRPGGLGRWLRRMRLKEWQHIWMVSEEYCVSADICLLGCVGAVWCQVIERDTGTCMSFARSVSFPRDIAFAESSVRGVTSWRDEGRYITFEYQPQAGGLWSCTFNLPLDNGEKLKGQVSVYPEPESLALVHPLHRNRAVYLHREAGNRAEGLITLGMRELRFEHDAQAGFEYVRSFPDAATRYTALTASGVTGDGRRLGLSLSQGLYGAADCHVWLDGVLHALDAVEFTPPPHAGEVWHIASERCMLEFHPICTQSQSLDHRLVKSKRVRHYGTLEGYLRFGGGLMQVTGPFGICETLNAAW